MGNSLFLCQKGLIFEKKHFFRQFFTIKCKADVAKLNFFL